MFTIQIFRHWQDHNQTLGSLVVFNDEGLPIFSSASIERGWRNNERNVSCIPTGKYPIFYEWSTRFQKKLWELKNVPARSETKIHPANSYFQLQGCIALGIKLKDINDDGYIDVTNSKMTQALFETAMKRAREAQIIIKNTF